MDRCQGPGVWGIVRMERGDGELAFNGDRVSV